jgi:hypothetical protein
MGAWGSDTFENDTACDWSASLEGSDDFDVIEQAFAAVEEVGDEYLDADVACEGLAACDAVARLLGRFGQRDAYTESLDQWIRAHPLQPSPALVQRALSTLARIVGENSELADLWDESPDGAWRAKVEELRNRLTR